MKSGQLGLTELISATSGSLRPLRAETERSQRWIRLLNDHFL